eukprot:90483_1
MWRVCGTQPSLSILIYDAFEENWNEWIPLKGAWRIAPAKSQIVVASNNTMLRGENGGIHCLIATKYGRSKAARDLQDVFSSDNAVLMQGYVYKESPSKIRKTNWNDCGLWCKIMRPFVIMITRI